MKSIYTDSSFDEIRKLKENSIDQISVDVPAVKEAATKTLDETISSSQDTDTNIIIQDQNPNQQIFHIGSSKDFSLKKITKKITTKDDGSDIILDICFDHYPKKESNIDSRIICFVNYINQIISISTIKFTIIFRGLYITNFSVLNETINKKVVLMMKQNIFNKPPEETIKFFNIKMI